MSFQETTVYLQGIQEVFIIGMIILINVTRKMSYLRVLRGNDMILCVYISTLTLKFPLFL